MPNDTSAAEQAYVASLEAAAATQDLSQDLQPRTRDLSIAFTVIAAAFVSIRFIARWRQGLKIGWDDWLILLALVMLFGNLGINLAMISQGLGLHSGVLTVDELGRLNQTILGAEILYVTNVNMYKISLLFLYVRIFPIRTIRLGSYICGGLSTAWNLACIFAATFQCTPREKLWMPWVSGTCINIFLAQLCISIPSILCDIAILCLPLPQIWRLKTNIVQRVSLLFIFSLGSYVVFASIWRFRVYLYYDANDIPYTLAEGCAWNIIEISSGIVSSCLPTLGGIIKFAFGRWYTNSSKSRSYPFGNSAQKRSNIVNMGSSSTNQLGNAWSRVDDSADPTISKAYSTKVTVSQQRAGSWDNSSGDDIPLSSIRREYKIEMTEGRIE
ncbi:hypothetical protein BX600DRAFT_469307 [Xylariales sp. PMI_506]|nr:hypothetical protein BX600DRAFT_469307 [Xylariales sp. PMI_506]